MKIFPFSSQSGCSHLPGFNGDYICEITMRQVK
jgi:hypothetical protein